MVSSFSETVPARDVNAGIHPEMYVDIPRVAARAARALLNLCTMWRKDLKHWRH